MFRFAIPATVALGLIAFSAQSQASNLDAGTGVAPMAWHLSHEGETAKLAYGMAHSDQLALMITCEPGQTQAVLYGDVQPVAPRLIHASMEATPIDPLSGGLSQESRLSIRDPALQGLARRGTLQVEGDDGVFELTADREERRMISDFFAYCGNDRA